MTIIIGLSIILIISNSCCHKKTTIFLVQTDFLPITGGAQKKCSGGIITLYYMLVIAGLVASYIVTFIDNYRLGTFTTMI